MIKNEQELLVTKSWVEKFQQAIISLHQNEEKRRKDPEGWKLLIDSYYAHIKNLHSEIGEYELLTNHNPRHPLVLQNVNIRIDEIGEILVKARIAQKIPEKEIAALINLTEEQIKEYEKKDYQNASFETVVEVAEALGIKLQHCIVVSEINDFLHSTLTKIQQFDNVSPEIKVASYTVSL